MNYDEASDFLTRISRNEVIKRIKKDADNLFARPKGTHYEQEMAKLMQETKDEWDNEYWEYIEEQK